MVRSEMLLAPLDAFADLDALSRIHHQPENNPVREAVIDDAAVVQLAIVQLDCFRTRAVGDFERSAPCGPDRAGLAVPAQVQAVASVGDRQRQGIGIAVMGGALAGRYMYRRSETTEGAEQEHGE